jgi:hypothetical protein
MTESNNHLALYDSAKAALSKAVRVDEVKNIRDKAMAIKAAAKIAKDREMEANAYELRARAERRLGEMMAAQKETVGLNTGAKGVGKKPEVRDSQKPTLAETGIDKNLAHRARSAAAMTDEAFTDHVETERELILHKPFTNHYPETEEQKAERLAAAREERAKFKKKLAARRKEIEAEQPDDDDDYTETERREVTACDYILNAWETAPPEDRALFVRSVYSEILEYMPPAEWALSGAIEDAN